MSLGMLGVESSTLEIHGNVHTLSKQYTDAFYYRGIWVKSAQTQTSQSIDIP